MSDRADGGGGPGDDAALIRAFLDGDQHGVECLDGWIRRAAWPFRHRLGEEWEDLLQDLRLEVTRLLRQQAFRGEARLCTYVWRVTNHACIDRLRGRAQQRWSGIEEVGERLAAEGLVEGSAEPAYVTRDLVLQVLERTPAECRRLWGLLLEGLSYSEMSRRLRLSEGALRVRVLRCRKRATALRRRLLRGLEV